MPKIFILKNLEGVGLIKNNIWSKVESCREKKKWGSKSDRKGFYGLELSKSRLLEC